jgi:hypothetical protein
LPGSHKEPGGGDDGCLCPHHLRNY